MKQTSIEWFFENLNIGSNDRIKILLEQAKEMHKQEIIEAYNSGQQIPPFDFSEQYYNETYNK